MKIFHGTADYSLEGFLKSKPKKYKRTYVPDKRSCFSCSTDFNEAAKFALRKTPANLSKTGIVLEFENLDLEPYKDFIFCQDHSSFIDEKEIVIFNVNKIKLIAVYRFKRKDSSTDSLMRKMGYLTEDWEKQEIKSIC